METEHLVYRMCSLTWFAKTPHIEMSILLLLPRLFEDVLGLMSVLTLFISDLDRSSNRTVEAPLDTPFSLVRRLLKIAPINLDLLSLSGKMAVGKLERVSILSLALLSS
jgi:hypothetical protein